MQLVELANELGLKESYLKSHWALIVKRYDGYGIKLVKLGRGKLSNYGIKSYNDSEVRFTPKK